MSGWDFQGSPLDSLSSSNPSLQSNYLTEVCPSCHKTVQTGRFCSECGSSLSILNSTADNSLFSEIQFNNTSLGGETGWNNPSFSGLSSTLQPDFQTNPTTTHLPLSSGFSTRRFSLDVSDNPISSLNGDSSFSPPTQSLNSLFMSHQSSKLPSRQRSSSGILSFPSSLLPREDSVLTSTAYDIDPFESSTEPLFQGSIDFTAETSLMNNPLSYHLPEDEDHSLQPAGSKCTDHSFNEVDLSTLPNSYDFNLLPTDSFLLPSNTDFHSSRKNSMQSVKQDDFVSGTTTTFPSNSYSSFSYTPFSSSQPGFRNERSNSLISPIPSYSSHMNSSSILSSSYKGKYLDISESKKLNEFNSLYTNLVELVCTQNGSKNLQTYLNSSMSDTVREIVIDSIIQKIEPTGCKIICDTFGNYFYQLLFKKASSSQKEQLLHCMLFPRGDDEGSTIYEISINKTGTFAFQNIIDYMADHDELGRLVMKALQKSIFNGTTENVILQLIKENKGTHIIQRIMKTFSMELWEPIYSILLTNCYMIAMDRNGSMVLRLCYDLVTLSKKQAIAQDIINHSLELAVDPVGNYVVQHILSIPKSVNEEEEKVYEGFITAILKQLSGHYVELSKQKYSSNVVEKSIVNSVQLNDQIIFNEILNENAIVQLLENHFGIYVLQKTLQSLSSEELKKVDSEVKEKLQVNGNYGVALLSKWKQIVNKVV